MADRKRNASRSQAAALKQRNADAAQARSSEVEKAQPVKSIGTTTPEERRETTKQESKKQERKVPVQREAKSAFSWDAQIRKYRFGRFVLEAYYELRHKVTWPTFEQARNMTIIVLILSAIVGAVLSLVDLGLYHLFLLINGV